MNTSSTTQIHLVISEPEGREWTYPMDAESNVIVGSSESCGILLKSEKIAPMHCSIRLNEGQLWIRDWLPEGDTIVNGSYLTDETELQEGDRIGLGGFQIVVALPDSSPESTSPAHSVEPTKSGLSRSLDQIDQLRAMIDEPAPTFEFSEPTHSVVDDTNWDEPSYESNREDLESPANLAATNPPETGKEPSAYEHHVDVDEVELMREEIEFLQDELKERDARIQELEAQDSADHMTLPETPDEGEVAKLVHRLEELLDELDGSDRRIRTLEDLLKASEDMNQAEQEERYQLEVWVGNIEKLVSEREHEWKAENERLKAQVERLKADYKAVQQAAPPKVAESSASDQAQKKYQQAAEQLHQQNLQLREKLTEAVTQCETLAARVTAMESTSDQVVDAQVTQQKMQELQVEVTRERAEIARQRAELARLHDELEQKTAQIPESGNRDADRRVKAMRQHLREIHETEKTNKPESGLGARISRLWNRLDR